MAVIYITAISSPDQRCEITPLPSAKPCQGQTREESGNPWDPGVRDPRTGIISFITQWPLSLETRRTIQLAQRGRLPHFKAGCLHHVSS